MKIDYQLAERWIKPNAKVLDLGCGDGSLLAHLKHTRQIFGYGIELDQEKITDCIAKGVNVIEQDLNLGLARFADKSFDTVVMARALQAVDEPDQLLLDMLRVGKEVIVTFPNFAHWQNRIWLGIKGRMPMSDALPYAWYNTPNIHLCTFKDFEQLCADNDIKILNRFAVQESEKPYPWAVAQIIRKNPNLLADVAIYRVTKA